jgi:hypothetical protein
MKEGWRSTLYHSLHRLLPVMGSLLGVRNRLVAEARSMRATIVWYESESRGDFRETVYPAILSGGMRRKFDQRAGRRSDPIFLEPMSYNKPPDGVKNFNS